jgi:hypothetical protein
MDDGAWIQVWMGVLRGPDFTDAVNACLDNIEEAETAQELGKHCGIFGGLLRRHREQARLGLAEALMRELRIEPTIHVAIMIMNDAFGQIAHIGEIDALFARPGRVRDTQHLMTQAKRKIAADKASSDAAFERYGKLYSRYTFIQKARVKEIKQIRKAERDRRRS